MSLNLLTVTRITGRTRRNTVKRHHHRRVHHGRHTVLTPGSPFSLIVCPPVGFHRNHVGVKRLHLRRGVQNVRARGLFTNVTGRLTNNNVNVRMMTLNVNRRRARLNVIGRDTVTNFTGLRLLERVSLNQEIKLRREGRHPYQ